MDMVNDGKDIRLDTPQAVKDHPAHEVVKRFFYEG